MKNKPYQILLRGIEEDKINKLKNHFEKEYGMKLSKVDVVRISITRLYNALFKSKEK